MKIECPGERQERKLERWQRQGQRNVKRPDKEGDRLRMDTDRERWTDQRTEVGG